MSDEILQQVLEKAHGVETESIDVGTLSPVELAGVAFVLDRPQLIDPSCFLNIYEAINAIFRYLGKEWIIAIPRAIGIRRESGIYPTQSKITLEDCLKCALMLAGEPWAQELAQEEKTKQERAEQEFKDLIFDQAQMVDDDAVDD